jgi:hypothetical protein
MGYRWLPVLIVALWLCGCEAQKEPPPDAVVAKTADQPLAGSTDSFGLPLEIVVEVPEVPPELQGPSPPIKESH